ncbi:Trafficking protein particle complex subunit BET5 [Elasticomyces elasticus]|nr:Trafficking protein particle complex subunit BET5 [Elasticomyces elasticus]
MSPAFRFTRLNANPSFLSYRTGEYKLHYFETPTNLKFVMLTDTRINNMRTVLHQIWSNLYVEYVVKNPLSPVEHPGGIGVANELFELGLNTFILCQRARSVAVRYDMSRIPQPDLVANQYIGALNVDVRLRYRPLDCATKQYEDTGLKGRKISTH